MKSKNKIKFIIASPAGDAGLCNRIKCIASVMRLADITKQIPLLNWPVSFTCGARFSDLFEKTTKLKEITDKELGEIKKDNNFAECSSYNDLLNNKKKYSIFSTWRFILLPEEVPENFARVFPEGNGRYIDLEYERIPAKLKKEFLIYIKRLKPIKSIRNAVESICRKHNFKDAKNLVGVHARRTEFLLNADGRGRVSSDERFFERMRQILNENPKARFFLATDSKETQENFINKFGSKIIVFSGKSWDKSSKESIQHALIDLLLLSKTRHILGTYLSTFTEIAWWLGNCKADVEIIGAKEEKQKVLERYRKITHELFAIKLMRKPLKFLRARFKIFRWLIDKILYLRNIKR